MVAASPRNRRARVARAAGAAQGGPPWFRAFAAHPAALHNIAAVLLTLDAAGRVRHASRGAGKLFGVKSRSLKGVPVQRLLPGLDLREIARNGSPAWIGNSADRPRPPLSKNLRGDKHAITGPSRRPETPVRLRHVLVLVGEGDSQAARISANLHHESRHLAAIVEQADDAILSVGADHKITLFNHGAERVFGYTAAEALGQPLNLLIPDRFHERHDGHMKRFAEGGEQARQMGDRGEIVARRKNGEEFPAEASILKLEIDGETAFTAILRDTTAQKREEQTLLLAKKQAEVASRAKSVFLANMSHELRTPLNAIIGFSQVMLQHVHGLLGHPKYEGYVTNILESGEILLNIINDILDMSKIEAGRVELDFTAIAVEEAVDSIVRMLGERAVSARLRLSMKIAPNLPQLRADERMVKQILLNLVSNAIKFTPEGGEIVIAARMQPNGDLTLSVRDTGIGMAAEDIPKALEPFGQVNGAHARRYTGTGLGLALVKSMIELHGGALTIDSGEKLGTTATINFPAALVVRRKSQAAPRPNDELHGDAEKGIRAPPGSHATHQRNL